MELQSVSRGDVHVTGIPGAYYPVVRPTRVVRVPRGYAVPNRCVRLLDVLARHQLTTVAADRMRDAIAEVRRVTAKVSARAGTDKALSGPFGQLRSCMDAYTVFPTNQVGGGVLVLLLEPDSQFGAHRYPELGEPYPLLRLV
jgi:hypothetical protein